MLEFIQRMFIEPMTCTRNSSQCQSYSNEQNIPSLFFFFHKECGWYERWKWDKEDELVRGESEKRY